jgi:sulfite reductase (NADPH) flavoprotein alpha-component
MHLFAGARHPGQDLFFAHELHAWLASGQLSSLHTAFSRGSPGRYVQDLLRQDSARIATWLAQGAQVRVCGSQAMAQAVEAVLQDILARQGQSLHELKEAQRYAQDVF